MERGGKPQSNRSSSDEQNVKNEKKSLRLSGAHPLGDLTDVADIVHVNFVSVKPVVPMTTGHCSINTLIDTGASISVVSSQAVESLGLPTSKGKECIMEMADGQRTASSLWARVPITWQQSVFDVHAVVIEAPTRDFDLILGRSDQRQMFGDVLFREDGTIHAIKSGVQTEISKSPRRESVSEVSIESGYAVAATELDYVMSSVESDNKMDCKTAIVELDPDGESVVFPEETTKQMIQLAQESLAKASFPPEQSNWLYDLVKQLPGLVRRHVIPAVPQNEAFLERMPRARIRVKDVDHLPTHSPSQMGPKLTKKLKETITELCKGGLLEPATSDTATKVMLIPKPQNPRELRLVCDYRDLNVCVEKDLYSVPRISTCLQNFEGRSVFSKLDLKSFFFQIPLDAASRPYTTITTPFGLYQWNVMPQGLTTSPAVAQRFIDWVLSAEGSIDGVDLRDYGVTAFIDDIALATRTVAEHRWLLEQVLRRLHAHGVQLRFDKSEFFVSRMSFLGHVVDAESEPGITLIRADPKHVAAIRDFPTPTSVTSLRRFLGMTVFLQQLVDGHACLAAPLHELTKQDVDWKWETEHETAFNDLKESLALDPFVALPNETDPFVLRLDASNVCIGGALLQRTNRGEKVIAYISRKFSATEQNWSTWEKELYALVHAIKLFGYLLIDSAHPVTFMCDHKPLQHWRTLPINDKVVRWMNILNTFEWTFEYVPGPKNVLADALSRPDGVGKETPSFADCIQDNTRALCTFSHVSMNPTSWGSVNSLVLPDGQFLRRIRDSYESDTDGVLERLRNGENVELFSLENGFIYRKSELPRTDAPKVLYIPRHAVELWGEILRHTHEDVAMHANAEKTHHKLMRRWYWKDMKNDVNKWVKGCDICSRNAPTTRRHYLPRAVPMPERCFSVLAADLKTGLPRDAHKNEGYLVLIDFLSRLAILIPTPRTLTEEHLQWLLEVHLFSKWGYPTRIVTDQGSNLASRLMKISALRGGFEHSPSSSGNPKTASVAERAIRTTLDYLRKYVNAHAQSQPERWSEALPAIEFAYNDSVNPRTYPWTPFMVAYGREPWHPIQQDVQQYFPTQPEAKTPAQKQATENFSRFLRTKFEVIKDAKANYRRLTNEFLETSRNKFSYFSPFSIGDLVWLTDVNLKGKLKEPALRPKRQGPFRIAEVAERNDYRLEPCERTPESERKVLDRIVQPINGERLFKYNETYVPSYGTDFENDILLGDVPDQNDSARVLERTLISQLSLPKLQRPLVILDIGCGEKSLGKGINELFGDRRPVTLRYLSIDVDPKTDPDFCWDILTFFENLASSDDHTRELLSPGKVDIIWFSSRCDPFSPANTRGSRDIQEGLTLVEKGIEIATYLKPRVFFMESANSGEHRLSNQPRMKELERQYRLSPHPCTQCKYGFLNKKPTCIWSTIPLSLMSCTKDTPCETLQHYSRHLLTSQNGPSGVHNEIPGLSRRLSGRVAPGLIQVCLYKAVMHCLTSDIPAFAA